jgi:hypothetical protein
MKADTLSSIYMPVLQVAQSLGLVAPCTVRTWSSWWQEARFPGNRLPEVRLSRKLLNPITRRRVLADYGEHGCETTAAGLFAHELGHMFRHTWIRNRRVAPLQGYRDVFGSRVRFEDPWDDMLDYLEDHPDLVLDTDQYLNWYAWSDHEEDFCECFAELIMADGDCSAYRDRPGVYQKLRFIQQAGLKVQQADANLRKSTRQGKAYLFAGETAFTCPEAGHRYGVPDVADTYMCPCGAPVIRDGHRITHEAVEAP